MAPQVGLEPTTLRLTAGCSAIELLRSVECGIVVSIITSPLPLWKGGACYLQRGWVFATLRSRFARRTVSHRSSMEGAYVRSVALGSRPAVCLHVRSYRDC